MLGECYSAGYGCKSSRKSAFEYFTAAARQGHGLAMVNLGILWQFAGITEEDGSPQELEGMRWIRRAVHYGKDAAAASLIAKSHNVKSMSKAWKWVARQWSLNHPAETAKIRKPCEHTLAALWQVRG